jgi:hypothetical protein
MSTRKETIDEKGYQSQTPRTTNQLPRKTKWLLRVHPNQIGERQLNQLSLGPKKKQGCPATGKPECAAKWSSPSKGKGRNSMKSKHKSC